MPKWGPRDRMSFCKDVSWTSDRLMIVSSETQREPNLPFRSLVRLRSFRSFSWWERPEYIWERKCQSVVWSLSFSFNVYYFCLPPTYAIPTISFMHWFFCSTNTMCTSFWNDLSLKRLRISWEKNVVQYLKGLPVITNQSSDSLQIIWITLP